jgi:hypothetical protein
MYDYCDCKLKIYLCDVKISSFAFWQASLDAHKAITLSSKIFSLLF